MDICVQKFGGSSLATSEQRVHVCDRINEAYEKGCHPVVVVSAMGRAGDPYATDTLLSLVKSADSQQDARNLDLLLACGEIISAVVLSEALNARGLKAQAVTGWQGGILTDANHGSARILSINPKKIYSLIEAGVIPVVAGFQGATNDGEITTLGRGGSDTTAVALAAVLKTGYVEIYTDVDGIKAVDPRIIPDAPTLSTLTYREIMEMAHLGAKVIHPRAVEIGMEAGITIRVLSTVEPGKGTIISSGKEVEHPISDRVVTGIAYISNRAHVRIASEQDFNQSKLALQIFQELANHGVSVDLIYLSPNLIAFIIDQEMSDLVKKVLAPYRLNISVEKGYTKVSVVGAGMHGVPGVMARVVQSLEQAKVGIYHTTDSHANISCLIKEDKLTDAVQALFQEFELSNKEGQE